MGPLMLEHRFHLAPPMRFIRNRIALKMAAQGFLEPIELLPAAQQLLFATEQQRGYKLGREAIETFVCQMPAPRPGEHGIDEIPHARFRIVSRDLVSRGQIVSVQNGFKAFKRGIANFRPQPFLDAAFWRALVFKVAEHVEVGAGGIDDPAQFGLAEFLH